MEKKLVFLLGKILLLGIKTQLFRFYIIDFLYNEEPAPPKDIHPGR
jgi:hypothetical protein